MRDEQKQQYQQAHNPTFNLNAPSDAQQTMDWSDVGSQGVKNLLPSTGRAVYGMVEPLLHPITTAENIYGLGEGAYSKAKGGPQWRVSSPTPGFSTLMTSAPRSAKFWVHQGPARTRLRSKTRI